MKTVFNLRSLPAALHQGSCVTIGNFDGVHLGHQALIRRLIQISHAKNLPAALITFDPHPLEVLLGQDSPPRLTTLETRLALFESLGLNLALVIPFTRKFAALTPEAFAQRVLTRSLRARALIVGHDFSLGKQRSGNAARLAELGAALGFTVEQLPPVTADGDVISSSRIRTLIRAGQVAALPPLLGRPYAVSGTVVHGFKRGSSLLGFPTANIDSGKLLLPAAGVYAVHARLPEQPHDPCLAPPALLGVASVGHNPTFNGSALTLEVHLLDFNQEIYGQPACITFLQRLRDERRFPGPKELIEQIKLDIVQARALRPL